MPASEAKLNPWFIVLMIANGDGLPDYDGVRADIAAWRPKVRPGGVLAGHDYAYHQPGVIRAVDEMIETFAVCGPGTDCWWSVVP